MKAKSIASLLLAGAVFLSNGAGMTASAAKTYDSEVSIPLGYYVVLTDGIADIRDTHEGTISQEDYEEAVSKLTNSTESQYNSQLNSDPFMDYILSNQYGVGLGDYGSLMDMLPDAGTSFTTVMTEEEFNSLIGQLGADAQNRYNEARENAQKNAEGTTKEAAEEIKDLAEQIINGVDPNTGIPYSEFIDLNTPSYDPNSFIAENLPAVEQALADAMENVGYPVMDTSTMDQMHDDFIEAYQQAYDDYCDMADTDLDGLSSLDIFYDMASLSNESINAFDSSIAANGNDWLTATYKDNNYLVYSVSEDYKSFSNYINSHQLTITNSDGTEEALSTNSKSESGYVIDDTMNTLCENNLSWWENTMQNWGMQDSTFFGFDSDGYARAGKSMNGSKITCECGEALTTSNATSFYLSNNNEYYCASCAAKHLADNDCILGENNQYNSDGTKNENYNGDKWADGDDTYIVHFINISDAGPTNAEIAYYSPMLDLYTLDELETLFPMDGTIPDAETAWTILMDGLDSGYDYNDDLDKIWGDFQNYLNPYALGDLDNPSMWSADDLKTLEDGLNHFAATGELTDDLLALLGDKIDLTGMDVSPQDQAAQSKTDHQNKARQILDTSDYNDIENKVFGEWPSDPDMWSDSMKSLYDEWMNSYNTDDSFKATLQDMVNQGVFDNFDTILDEINRYLDNFNDYTSINDTVTVTTVIDVSDDLNVTQSGYYWLPGEVKLEIKNYKSKNIIETHTCSANDTYTWRPSAVGEYLSERSYTGYQIQYAIGTYNTTITCYAEGVEITSKTVSRVRTDEQSPSEARSTGNYEEQDVDAMKITVTELNLDIENEDFYDTERVY